MSLPELGVGLTYSSGVAPILESEPGIVDVLEVEPQTLWYESRSGSEKYRVDEEAIARLASFNCAKIIHGVGFPVGGTRPPDPEQFPPMLKVAADLKALWASEHLSFNKFRGRNGISRTGFFLPPRQTREGVSKAVGSIRCMADKLSIPFAVETGVNYLKPREDELADGEFVRAVVEAADCGILLDLHNIWTNEINGRQTAEEFLSQIPLERVWEVHLAGGMKYKDYWLDAHSGAVPGQVVELARKTIPRLPNLGALIFELYPSFLPEVGLDLVRSQLDVLHDLWNLRNRQASEPISRPPANRCPRAMDAPHDAPSPVEWEETLAAVVTGSAASGDLADEILADPGVALYRELVAEFRSSMLVSSLKLTSRLLLLTLGQEGFKALLAEHWKHATPELFASTEAENFAEFLEGQHLDVPYLDEVLAFERAVLAALIYGERHLVSFTHDPLALLDALARRQLPTNLASGDFEVEVTPDTAAPFAEMDRSGPHASLGQI